MIKETITYEDFNGNERTEDFYFHLSTAEMVEWENSLDGGLAQRIKRMIMEQDGKQILQTFKDLLFKSYGVRSDDGRRFIKSEQISKDFSETPAYNKLFMSLVTDSTKAAAFVNSIMPASLEKEVAESKPNLSVVPKDTPTATIE